MREHVPQAMNSTSAASERVFNLAGRLINKFRTRLSPDIAGKLLFVSENSKWYKDEVARLREMENN